MPLHKSVSVRVPATSANLGPGFDCLGMALNVYNDVTVRTDVTEYSMTVEGEGAADLPRGPTNLVVRGLQLAFKEAGYSTMPPVSIHLVNRIPIGAGLGSSSAAIVSGLLAGLALTDTRLPVEREERELQLASTIEGHVDNLAPCIYGGMQVGIHTGARWYTTAVNVPQGLQCILFIPEERQETEACRAILPASVSRSDAVFNIGRTALLVNAFASGNLDDLPIATEDALHQPIRSTIMPALKVCVAAALAAGAKGAFLSGAGSSIMALTSGRKGDIFGQASFERRDTTVAHAMQRAAADIGMRGRLLVTNPSSLGAHVIAIDDDSALVLSGQTLRVAPQSAEPSATSVKAHPAPSTVAPAPATHNASPSAPAPAPSIRYVSSRCPSAQHSLPHASVSFKEAVLTGIAPDGGLFVPLTIPTMPELTIRTWGAPGSTATYADVAFEVLRAWVGEDQIPAADLRALVDRSYAPATGAHDGGNGGAAAAGGGVWDTPEIAPLVHLPLHYTGGAVSSGGDTPQEGPPSVWLLEQFHGPTCAFKDHALQLLGNLFEYLLLQEQHPGKGKAAPHAHENGAPAPAAAPGARRPLHAGITILGATSGDTGSAAIAGMRGKQGVEVVILHPAGRVAPVQELQMTTVLDRNVHNVAVTGATFDDCQAIVKAAFADQAFNARHSLSAVNSINWARVLAQTIYYFWAYAQMLRKRGPTPASAPLPRVTFIVPTGNFGNALSGWYASRMGLPMAPIVVATNANDILHRFISRGDYSLAGGSALATLAPSMDIQLASNLERYLFHVSGGDGGAVSAWMTEIRAARRLASFPPACLATLQADFTSAAADDGAIDAVVERYLGAERYALCPHTATGVHAAELLSQLAPGPFSAACPSVIVLATAHPAKFAAGTPALKSLYTRVFSANAESAGAAGGGDGAVRPPLPPQMVGLGDRPRVCATVGPSVEAVQAFVDAVVSR